MKKVSPFSIIIPYFNSSIYLDRLFLTISDYINKDCEIIIVDDCSRDEEIVKLEEKISSVNAKNIFLKRCDVNSGAAFARQIGVDLASGEYILFLDSDDGWALNRAFILIEFMKKKNLDILGSKTNITDENEFISTRKDKFLQNGRSISFIDFLFKNYYSTPSVIVKKSVFQLNCFNTNMRYSEDFECWRRNVYSSESFLMYDSGCYSFKHSYMSNNKNSLSTATRKMSIGEVKGLMYLFKNNNINLGYKLLLPFAILYSFIKALYREIHILMVSK